MEGQLAVPFHFAAEFLILAVALGACLDAVRRARAGGGVGAGAQALGFAVLAAAQIGHGSRLSMLAEDGATVGVAIRAAGFALIALGARRVTHASAHTTLVAGIAVAPGLFPAGASSQLALVPGVAAAVASARGWSAHRRDQDPASFAFAIGFAAFAIGEVLLVLAPASGGSMLTASHATRFAGALLLVRWLASPISRSVRLRFVATFVVVLTVLVLVLSATLTAIISRNLEREGLRRLEVTAEARRTTLDGRVRDDQQFVNNLAAGDRAALPSAQNLSVMSCLFDYTYYLSVERSGKVKAGAARPSGGCNATAGKLSPPVPLSMRAVIPGTRTVASSCSRATSSLELLTGTDPRKPAVLAVVACAPVSVNGAAGGKLVFVRLLQEAFLGRERGGAESDLTLVVAGDVVASTLKGSQGTVMVRALGGRLRTLVEEEQAAIGESVTVDGERAFVSCLPLRRKTGASETIATLCVSTTQSAVRESQEALNRTLFLIALGVAAIAAAFAWAAGGRVSRPIVALTHAAEAVRRGDLSARAPAAHGDELGALGRAFNDMAASLDRSTADLRAAAVTEADLRGQLEAIMQSMSDALIATDPEGRITITNRAAEGIVGLTAAKMQGRLLSEVLRGPSSTGRAVGDAAMLESAMSATLERGTTRTPVAITAAPLRDSRGAITGRVIVMRDTSAETQAERMKSEFLSNVSHELRTPLTPIKGYTEILKRKKFPKEKAESFLDGILESTERLERIVEILVDFAAMEAGRLKPRTEAVDLRAFLESVVARWKARGGAKLSLKIAPGVPHADADPRLLGKSLDELIDNAIKFSPGGAVVELQAAPVAATNGSRARKVSAVRITVRDRGVGIPADKMPSLFQDFQQLDGSETREFGGLGLGLAYVKRVAAVHGGEVSAESKPGKGSDFSLVLPAADIKTKTPAPKPVKPAPAKRRATGAKR